jgi:hypothetical protein
MKRFSFCIVFTAAVGSLCFTDVANLPAEDRKALQDSSRFHEVHSTSDLPGKRLIWAAVGGEYYVVHYERGRMAHTFHVLGAKLTQNDAKPKVVLRAVGGPVRDYAGFLDALRSAKLDDR